MSPKASRISRVINVLFWVGIWLGIVIWTEVWGRWIPMAAESILPIMLGGFIHIAFRPGDHTA
jgi:hypothetical protein